MSKRPRDDGVVDGSVREAEEEEDGPTVVESSSGAPSTSHASGASAAQVAARAALADLPCAEMYEKSFMHRDHVTHIVCTSSDFVITGSRDGQVKFWKKMQVGIEFVKHFRAQYASRQPLEPSV